MPVELHEDGKIVELTLSGKLTSADYGHFVPVIERLIAANGKIRILARLHDFHGWELGALWDDLKFDMKHFHHIERLALVGHSMWEQGMAWFCKPFTTASVKYFDESKLDEAKAWVRA